MTLILGIETSCDETAAAVVEDGRRVRSSVVASQHELHEQYGGVVPEIASRAHLERISPVVLEAIRAADVTFADMDAIAVGNRPGLIGSLLVGVTAAKALAWSLGKPLIAVDHVEAHLYAAALVDRAGEGTAGDVTDLPTPRYPALGLVVSGGHTSLYELSGPRELERLGSTIDDAIGEAYDKAAVILEAGYPGGPALDRLAQHGDASRGPRLPRSMLSPGSLDFSFSGLKTALLYAVRGNPQGRGGEAQFPRSAADLSPTQKQDVAAAFQEAAVDAVIRKLKRAVRMMRERDRPPQCLVIGGGVSANSLLRARTGRLARDLGLPALIPAMAYCVDNAAMIAGLAHASFLAGQFDGLDVPAVPTARR